MNCGNCQRMISAFLDGELDAARWETATRHMAGCEECARVFDDLDSLVRFTDETFSDEALPPNSQALWCRINNIIETEVAPQLAEERAEAERPGRIASLWHSSFSLSPAQLASAVIGVALISSLLTIVAFKNFSTPEDAFAESDGQPSLFERVLANVGFGETPWEKNQRRIREQKAAIEYWRGKVLQRRASWNVETRLVFDRNLNEIDKAVNEYTKTLQENPQDTISNEMLDSALKEKMELLREFSDL